MILRGRAKSLRRLVRSSGGMVGLVICLLIALAAVAAPLIAPYDPEQVSLSDALQSPSMRHLMGTDRFGRDVFSRVVTGSRVSLQMGIVSSFFSLTLGLAIGLPAGYTTGWRSSLLMRIADVMLALPSFLLAMATVAILGPGMFNAILAVGVARIPAYARLVHSSVLTVKQEVYVLAASSVGCRPWRVMLRHILPNIVPVLLVYTTLNVGTAILFGSALSFIGLGAQPPTPEWGSMISSERHLMRVAWWVTVFPGLAIMVTVLGVNLLGDSLRTLDPRLRDR